MAIHLDPTNGSFSSDGNWSATTVNEDGTIDRTTVIDGELADPTEFYVIARVVLTVPADSADEAIRIAKDTLESVDHWPTVDIDEAFPFG